MEENTNKGIGVSFFDLNDAGEVGQEAPRMCREASDRSSGERAREQGKTRVCGWREGRERGEMEPKAALGRAREEGGKGRESET